MKKTIRLNGMYRFMLDPEKKGIDNHYETLTYSDSICLPTTTSEAKKGSENPNYETGFLTDLYAYEGYAWFQKDLSFDPEDLGKKAILSLERTRISRVYIDDKFVGTYDSLCTGHRYDLTDYITSTTHTLTIMVSNVDYPVKGGHMTSPDTQTNWNGIVGRMTLTFYPDCQITKLRSDCDYKAKSAKITLNVDSYTEGDVTLRVLSRTMHLEDELVCYGEGAPSYEATYTLQKGANNIEIDYPLGDNALLWDEFDPYVYELSVTVGGDTRITYFGLKEFIAKDGHFYINGIKTFLRGKHDGMIFPLTGYAPMDLDGWLKVMSTSKEFGINHYRYHTCCPPDAAFLAADLLGIYMEPELPFWGTFTAPGDEGHDEVGQNYLIEEGFRILEEFSNHPSFVMMSMGNELWGSPEAINALLGRYKKVRPDVLFTQGSNNFQWVPNIQPNDDFFCGVRFTIDRQIRGSYAMCDKPQGHIQTKAPCTNINYEEAIFPSYESSAAQADEDGMIEIQYGTGVKKVKLTEAQSELIPNIPVVSHEIGQYETFPDFNEIEQYTGVLKARNFETFRDALDKKGLLSMAPDYFKASGALAVACYKDELETALRTPHMAGFQILDLQDFTGQGTALVGVLNSFMENKGLISDEDWRTFCSEAVIQAEFPTYVYKAASDFTADITFSYYGYETIENPTIEYAFTFENGNSESFSFTYTDAVLNGVTKLGKITYTLPDMDKPGKVTLNVSVEGTSIRNQYDLWIYPECDVAPDDDCDVNKTLAICTDVNATIDAAKEGKHVLLFLNGEKNPNSIEGTYCTDFWCYPMFKSISDWMKKERPIGTMGLFIRNEHPALQEFPCEFHSTPQWFSIVSNSRSTILDDTQIVPIVQTIDNFERNHRLGLIYEVRLTDTNTNVLVCGVALHELMKKDCPEAVWLYKSLLQYAISDLSGSKARETLYPCTLKEFAELFTKTSDTKED